MASATDIQIDKDAEGPDSPSAWLRLIIALVLSTVGGVGMWSVVVAMPSVQAEFGVGRADASLAYTFTMIGFGLSAIVMGRLADRFGIVVPLIIGTFSLGIGYIAAGFTGSITQFALVQGMLIGVGSSPTFGPLLADISLWFQRKRGVAIGIFASGNYLAGTLWPPVVQHFIAVAGWRKTYFGIAIFCVIVMLPLAWLLRKRATIVSHAPSAATAMRNELPLGFPPNTLQFFLIVAGLSCCVAMSMPQVHIVAYCGDLGYGVARGAQMLSLMLACGIVSRISFGFISDHLGGLRTLLLGSALQAIALLMFIPFNGLVSLYLLSAMFGLFQGGIVPAYAVVVREYFSPVQAATRISLTITATIFGMALGGWMSGKIFDLTGSYRMAFANGVAWNVLNLLIAYWLLRRSTKLVT